MNTLNLNGLEVLSWPSWLALFSLVAILLMVFKRSTRKTPKGKYSDSPMWTKPGFQYASGLLVLIIIGLTIV